MEQSLITSILFATLVAGTPLIIVALGELITEKSGVLNLGAEGTMAMGAVAGFAATHYSGNPYLGVLAGMTAGALMSLLFGLLTLTLMANQVASGLALAIFGVGLSAFIGKPYESLTLQAVPAIRIPLLADIPYIGPALFNQQSLVYFSWALLGGVIWFLYKSRAGLILRAVGESPASAHSIGYSVIGIRYLATTFGGAMAGIGGAFLSVFYTPLWVEGMVSGRSPSSAWYPSSGTAAPATAARSTERRAGKYHSAKLLGPSANARASASRGVYSAGSTSRASVQP
jgi:simple sugar transport system permease protein